MTSTESSALRAAALEALRPLVADRTLVLTASAARSERLHAFFTEAGARVTRLPFPQGDGDNTQRRFAEVERLLRAPSRDECAELSGLDPEGLALVYAGSFTAAASFCGRRVLGRRTLAQFSAERKDVQLELIRSDARIVPLPQRLPAADAPMVVQGVPSKGIAMATSHTYLLPGGADDRRIEQIVAKLAEDCEVATIRHFHPGVPCTLYGFVSAEGVVVVGAVEALVYWDPESWQIRATGVKWPLRAAPQAVRNAERAVGDVAKRLRTRYRYSGAFGTDGVLSNGRYLIHEINPRVCAGISLFDHLRPSAAPLAAVDVALRELPERCATLLSLVAAERDLRSPDAADVVWSWDGGRRRTTQPDDGLVPLVEARGF